jgi:hypothetical protein
VIDHCTAEVVRRYPCWRSSIWSQVNGPLWFWDYSVPNDRYSIIEWDRLIFEMPYRGR